MLLLLAGGWWLNGPGLRWIGSKVLRDTLAKSGLTGDFRIEGSLTGGISLHDVRLHGTGSIQQLNAGRITTSYRLKELLHGRIRSVSVHSVKLIVELDPPSGTTTGEEQPPFDLATLPDTLRTALSAAHQHVDPLDILLDDVALELHRNDQPVLTLAPSRIAHRGPSSPIELKLGTITGENGDHIEPRRFRIDWTPEKIEIAPFSTPANSKIDGLILDTRGGDSPLLSADAVVKNRRLSLRVASDLNSGSIQFDGDPLAWSEVAGDLGIETDFDFLLHQLELSFSGLGQDAAHWQSKFDLHLTNASWRDWQAQRIQVSARHDGPDATADWSLDALDASARGSASATWPDVESLLEAPVPASTMGTIRIQQVAAPFPELCQRFPIPATDTAIPASTLDAEWSLDFSEQKPELGFARLAFRATNPDHAPPLDLSIDWTAGSGSDTRLTVPGLDLKAKFSPDWKNYDASLQLAEHGIASLRPWLDPFYLVIPDDLIATAGWQGKGCFKPADHSGSLDLTHLRWSPADQASVEGHTRLDYQLPELALDIDHLSATRNAITLQLEGRVADHQLDLAGLTIKDAEGTLASGSATAPLPGDLTDWRALFESEAPWQLKLDTEPLELARINQLLPEEKAIAATGSLEATVKITGSPAKPIIQATLNGTKLQTTGEQQSIPPSQLTLKLETRDQRLETNGILQAGDWPELSLRAGSPLRVSQWIEKPDSLLDTPLDARAVLPPINLARLITPPESIRKLSGTLSADIGLAGTPRKPQFNGGATLRQFELETTDDRIVDIRNGIAEIDLDGTRLTITRLECDASGGTLRGSGSADLADPKNPLLDLRLEGKALPTWRDDSIIVRQDASLRLAGTLADATISGRIDVVQSLFFRDFEIIPLGIPFTTPSAPTLPTIDPPARHISSGALGAPPFGDWKLDLTLRTRDPFLIRGNLATGSITGEVRVGGTLGQPRPTGTLDIHNFEAELPLSRFKIPSGKIIFHPEAPFEPRLEIRGRSVLRPYEVNIFISGTTANPLISMSSNPPLPENEILTLLATGSTSSQLENSNAAFTKFIQLLLEEARRGRLRYGKELLPVLEFFKNIDLQVGEIDPYTGRDFTSVTVPINDRWLTSISFDDESHNRAVLIFVTRFK